ncbi:MAG: hypothetical protein KBT34_02915 [Prevotella sp.]|nr:hypothetical protein [Candidatus Prevotella equi]
MTQKWLNISYIEDFFYTLFQNKALGEVNVGDKLPDTLSKNVSRMTLISCGNMRDLHAYGSGSVLVFLFCKSDGKGKKNVPAMAEMEETVRQLVDACRHEHYNIERGSTYTNYDSNYDMHCNIVQVNITII